MKYFQLCLFLVFLSLHTAAQKTYIATAGESILSLSAVDAGTDVLTPVIRFSPFFNYAIQFHVNNGGGAGMYSGIDVRNVGFINKTETGHRIKDRSYALGVPLAFKFGNMDKNIYLALGGEAEFMFAWKRKTFVDNDKRKYDEWFSDETNFFNPSVMAEFNHRKSYVRLKYYLFDFLQYHSGGLYLQNGEHLPDYLLSSKLFYISFGTRFTKKDIQEKMQHKTYSTDAYQPPGKFQL